MLVGVASCYSLQAQDITDAVRYSTEQLGGTARFRAMSGAFGALGGDLSSININPASSAVFLNSEVGLTIGNYNINNDATFFGTNASDSGSNFDLNQAGAVFVFNNTDKSAPWKKVTLGINYQTTNNYNSNTFIAGFNPNNSIDQYFLYYAQGVPLSDLSLLQGESVTDLYQYLGQTYGYGDQQALLGYQSFIIDPLNNTDDNTDYISNANYNSVDQQYTLSTTGGERKINFNLATEFKDVLYIGANVNVHVIDFQKYTYLSEIGFNENSLIQETGFENNLSTYGNGVSLQVGAILKASQNLRLGASYQSPTWYKLQDELQQGAFGVYDGTLYDAYPNFINIYEDYKLKTPGKLTGSIAYIFGKSGLISFDYSRKDYSQSKFKPVNDSYFSLENSNIANSLATANSYRFGAEYRIKQLSLRGGYRFEEGPYKDETVGDLNGFSLGLGYNFGSTSIDLSYDTAKIESQHQLYNVGLTDRANIESKIDNIFFTINFKL